MSDTGSAVKVIIASGWSSLDGRTGVVVGYDNGCAKVQLDGYKWPMLWPLDELEEARK